jgi:hypothetical protein
MIILTGSFSHLVPDTLKDPVVILQWCYWGLTPAALVYLLYRTTGAEDISGDSCQAAAISAETEREKTAS